MKRRWLLLLVLPFLLISQPAYAAEGPVRLSVQPNADGTLTSTVTNSGDRSCKLAAIGDGTLTVLSVTRDGKQPDPEYRSMSYFPNYNQMLKDASRTVEPGQSISFTSPIRSVAIANGGGTASQWSLTDGRYEIRAVYRMPTSAGTDACLGSSNVATANLTTTDDGNDGIALWIVVAAGGALLLLVLVVVLLLVRRRYRSTAAALTAIALLAGTLGAAHPQRADAVLVGVPAEAASCMSLIRAHDVANLMPTIDDPNYRITIKLGEKTDTDSGPHDANISWNPNYTAKFEQDPTVAAWPCASLYHELTHAFDRKNNQLIASPCMHGQEGLAMIMAPSVKEVHATRVENAFRDAFALPTRTGYDAHGDLPPGKGTSFEDTQKDCAPSPPDKGKGGRDTSRLNPTGPRGHSTGDPHLATIDGRFFDFQAVGEFVLAKGPGLEVQVRQQPLDGSRVVSVNSAVAMRIGTDRVVFQLAGDKLTIRVNGHEQAVTGPVRLPGGGSIDLEDDLYFVDSKDGSEVQLNPIGAWGLVAQVYPAPALRGKLSGLLGNFDGKPDNDLDLPEQPTREQLYGTFADTWRVHDSLFDYAAGQTSATFTDRTFPDKVMTAADLPAGARDAARQVCSSYGMSGPDLDACVLDLAQTGQAAFAVGMAQTAAQKSDTTPPTPTPSDEPSITPQPGRDQPLADGEVVNASFDKPGQVDTYRLSLGAATVFRLGEITGDPNLDVELVGPDAPDSPGFTVTSNYQFRVRPGSKYSLRVRHSGNATGPYGFRLFTAKERRLSTSLNQQVSGNLDVAGRVDLYSFTLPQDTKVALPGGSGCDFAAAVIEDGAQPRSYSPTTPCDGAVFGTLTAGTKYLVVVWSPDGKTGPSSFRLGKEE